MPEFGTNEREILLGPRTRDSRSIWFSAAIGVALGLNLRLIAVVATPYVVLIPRIPRLKKGH